MEDKRVRKSKKNLKQTLIDLLAEKPFEQITITALCQAADISRITFYAHYNDKYELVDDIFQDMLDHATEEYHRLQLENNPDRDPIVSYCNLLDCILNTYHGHFNFFSHTAQDRNPYLYLSLYRYIQKHVEERTQKESHLLQPKYSSRKITGFLCHGLWGFINECHEEKCPLEQIRTETKELLKGLLRSGVLTQSK